MIEHLLHKHTNRFVSSYLVLLADMVLAGCSFGIASLLRFNLDFSELGSFPFYYCLSVVIAVRLVFFLWFRSYQGIIRHTSLEDIVTLLYAISGGSAVAGSLSFLLWQITDEVYYYIPVSILLIDYFCCLVLLIMSRFLAKAMYWEIVASVTGHRQPVLIYGAGSAGLMVRNTLMQDDKQRFTVVAFIDDNPNKIQKVIQGVKVVSRREAIERFILNEPVRPHVILAIDSLTAQQRTEITDCFFHHQVVVKTVPSTRQWINGQFNASQIRDIQIDDLLEREPIRLNDELISQNLCHQSVMVTGAAGSIGSELVRQIIRYKPSTLILLDQAESPLHDLIFAVRQAGLHESVRIVAQVSDITDPIRMRSIFGELVPDFVFHAAAYKHVPLMEEHPYEAVRTNALGTKILADLSVEFGVRTFVMISTDKAVNPTNVMGATKRLAEMYVQSLNQRPKNIHSTRFISTRFGNVLGSNGSVVNVFKEQIKAGGPVTVTHPDIIRYFMTIPEACQLVLEAGAMGKGGEVFVFDMGQPVRIVDLARKMINLSGFSVDADIKIVYSGLRPGEKLYEELLNHNERTLPTHHPKIMVARVVAPDDDVIDAAFRCLKTSLAQDSAVELVSWLKYIVPEYVSNNSVFESLDRQHLAPLLAK